MTRLPRRLLAVALLATLVGCDQPTTSSDAPPPGPAQPTAEGSPDEAPPEPGGPPAPPVELKVVDPDGFKSALEAQQGKVVLVDFWATWCAPCKERFPHIVELAQEHASDKLAVFSMACELSQEDQQNAAEFLSEVGAGSLTNLMSSLDINDTFEALKVPGEIPHYRLYDREGKLRYQFASRPDESQDLLGFEEIDAKLEELLGE